ncbi:MAG: M20/M25/M40 family metallo-hydrolase [Clostridia bacterium]|nr:M20/M25/M40 family metallo-hydrolase [Clostridia bacterium]
MREENKAKAVQLRKELHAMAEISLHELNTRAHIEKFLRENTTLDIHIENGWLWAMHREENAGKTIGFRADFDAVSTVNGAEHLCGHDGHAAALCAFALEIEGKAYGKNICLIFQHAEETGEGGAACAELIGRIEIDEIYGCHSLPGYPFGEICLKKGSFACASRGLILKMKGKSAHAAYPENGRNPAPALCELAVRLNEFTDPAAYEGMVMATLIGIRCGEKAFGMAASDGELYLTLRAHLNRDLEAMEAKIIAFLREKAEKGGFEFGFEHIDAFPGTENADSGVEKVEKAAEKAGYRLYSLEEPMRWSEDFGWYLMKCPGAYFGIGAGEDYPALHTPEFEYRDELIEKTVSMFENIAEL